MQVAPAPLSVARRSVRAAGRVLRWTGLDAVAMLAATLLGFHLIAFGGRSSLNRRMAAAAQLTGGRTIFIDARGNNSNDGRAPAARGLLVRERVARRSSPATA